MSRMAAEHDKGDIDATIDAQRFQGDFRKVAQGVNDMVAGHLAMNKKALACVDEFGKGNFEATLEKFPGKKAFINETIEQVRRNLKAVITDVDGLATAAVAGQLAFRADAQKHQHDFRKIVQGINGTLDAMTGPVREATLVLEKLSRRDLTARMEGSYQGDHARIKEALNATGEALHEAIAQVSQSVTQVSSAASQIASTSEAVASGASEQASALEETSASLQSMTTMTKQAADSAQQANGLARQAMEAASVGGAAMQEMSGAMGKIKAAAEGTSQIIRDINDIAFQTNLLALNAAVEAARAGDAGRGFAVVADEVRSLALRSKEAATKTEQLIRQSVSQAVEGETTARHVGEQLTAITGSVTKVTEIVAEIAATAKEQAVGIEQVTKAVEQMDKVTQQNAASSEESSSAAAELSSQSEELATMVATFRVGQAGAVRLDAPPQVSSARATGTNGAWAPPRATRTATGRPATPTA
jgi:methyl-accepting chemotaxis protein